MNATTSLSRCDKRIRSLSLFEEMTELLMSPASLYLSLHLILNLSTPESAYRVNISRINYEYYYYITSTPILVTAINLDIRFVWEKERYIIIFI